MSHKENVEPSQKDTVTCDFEIWCGNPSAAGPSMYPYRYTVQVPASLCNPYANQDDVYVFMDSLAGRYNNQVLLSRAWKCSTCSKTAKELYHGAVSFLCPGPLFNGSLADFIPSIIFTAVPVCDFGGDCDRNAAKMVKEIIFKNYAVEQIPGQKVSPRTCGTCTKEGLQLCGGCRLISYCSKECQATGWPIHKKSCKRAQKAKETMG